MEPLSLSLSWKSRVRPGSVQLFAGLVIAGACVATLHAEGLRNPPTGTFGLGRAGARFAQIDDASAVIHNPANLVDLDQAEAIGALNMVYIDIEYSGAAGDAETRDPWKYLPGIYYSQPIITNRLAAGVGLSVPYGLSNEWKQDGAFRYTAPHFTELKTINVNPSLSYRIFDNLSIGAGFNVMWSELTIKQLYPWALVVGNPAAPDGSLEAQGDGIGLGANAGLTWEWRPGHRIAATVRTPITVDYEGDFQVSNIPVGFPGVQSSSNFESQIQFPTIVGLGYGIEINENLRLEVNAEWLEFSNFDRLPIGVSALPPGLPASIPQNWDDTFTFGIGGDWRPAPNWMLRWSYQYYQSPVPDETFSPTIPDADQNAITVGAVYQWDRFTLAGSYGLVLYDDREIRNNVNPAYNGDYDITVHLVALSLGYRW